MQRHGRRCAAINLPKWEITGASVGRGGWGVGMGGCEGLGLKKKEKKTYGQQRFKKKNLIKYFCAEFRYGHTACEQVRAVNQPTVLQVLRDCGAARGPC